MPQNLSTSLSPFSSRPDIWALEEEGDQIRAASPEKRRKRGGGSDGGWRGQRHKREEDTHQSYPTFSLPPLAEKKKGLPFSGGKKVGPFPGEREVQKNGSSRKFMQRRREKSFLSRWHEEGCMKCLCWWW